MQSQVLPTSFKCMQLNNVLSVVTGTYLGAGGSVRARGDHEGGGEGWLVAGREMAILCACFLATLSSLSTLRLPSVLVRQRIILK